MTAITQGSPKMVREIRMGIRALDTEPGYENKALAVKILYAAELQWIVEHTTKVNGVNSMPELTLEQEKFLRPLHFQVMKYVTDMMGE